MSSLIDSNSKFSINPTSIQGMKRSRFDMSSNVKTSFNVGDLVPFDVLEVLPGDTFDVETNILARMQTLITPIMDDLYLDMYYFFVPNRLVWDHWKDFCGENTKSSWYPTTEYKIPQVIFDSASNIICNYWNHSLYSYMGIPLNVPILNNKEPVYDGKTVNFSVNALPFRAYHLIWNEWFRDQNSQNPILINTDDSDINYQKLHKFGRVLKVNKYHDYFTSCLPSPQKGPDVGLNLQGFAPVIPLNDGNSALPLKVPYKLLKESNPGDYNAYMRFGMPGENDWQPIPDGNKNLFMLVGSNGDGTVGGVGGYDISGASALQLTPSNLYAHLGDASSITINSLRLAFATQHLYEKDARGGSRYVEILKSHFGVTSPDYRLQRPELLSYKHIPININQVVQQTQNLDDTTPLGYTAAYSVTANQDGSFVKSFTEHGYIIGLACARYKHTYQTGLNRMWSRKSRFDFYWPVFANIGEQPVYNKEIYLGNARDNDNVFGYQEAWADYRYKPSIVTGEMRSNVPTSLDVWHLADDYSSLPMLSGDFLQEDVNTVNRVLAVSSDVSDQLFMDVYIRNYATRVMPTFSIPGLDKL